jgi:formylglycine-generating enzyme required for sulfatase activity
LRVVAPLGCVLLAGCSVLVGDPHGNRIFASDDASTDVSDPVDSTAPGADAHIGADTGVMDAGAMDAPDVGAMDAAEAGAMDAGATDATAMDAAVADADDAGVTDAAEAGATDASEGGCPGTAGPPAIRVSVDAGPSFCIDTMEISNGDYATFLASGFSLPAANVPAGCSGVTSYTPSTGWPSPYPRLPVIQVNWCQAYAYCAWAGKRLCGEIGGGSLPPSDMANASVSQWFFACSANGTLAYPYGNTFDVTVCGGNFTTSIENVGTPTQCVGGFPGLYNMSGNVWEWTDSCDATDPTAHCHAMGGAFDGTNTDNACNGQRPWTRTDGAANIGFRCCSDP